MGFLKKKLIINIFFIVIPLFLGLFFYVLSDQNVIVSKLILNLIPFKLPTLYIRHPVFVFFRNYMCDVFWAVSLESCIWLILSNCKKQLFISILISVVISFSLEFFQLFGFVSGTFDKVDLFFETIAIFMAGLILYYTLWRLNK